MQAGELAGYSAHLAQKGAAEKARRRAGKNAALASICAAFAAPPPLAPGRPRARDFGLSIAASSAFAGAPGAKTRETTPRRALRLADALRSKNNKQQKARTARSQAKHARLLALFIFAGARARQKPGKSSLLRALVNS